MLHQELQGVNYYELVSEWVSEWVSVKNNIYGTNSIFNRWKFIAGITQEKQIISFISIVVP